MANLKLIDELLEKTEYIYVLGIDGKPQMPTNRKVRVRSLFKSGMAKIVDTVPFTMQLLYENKPVLQPITEGQSWMLTDLSVQRKTTNEPI